MSSGLKAINSIAGSNCPLSGFKWWLIESSHCHWSTISPIHMCVQECKWIIARSELRFRPQTSAADQSPKNIEFKIFEIEFSHNCVLAMSIWGECCLGHFPHYSPFLSPLSAPLLMMREIIKQVHRDLFIGQVWLEPFPNGPVNRNLAGHEIGKNLPISRYECQSYNQPNEGYFAFFDGKKCPWLNRFPMELFVRPTGDCAYLSKCE